LDDNCQIKELLRRDVMIRKLLIGLAVVLGIAVAIFQTLLIGVLAVVVWIYLVRMVRKQKNNAFDERMEFQITDRCLKRLKAFLMVAGISFLVCIVSIIVHNVLSGLSEIEEPVSFIIAIAALLVFVIATAGGLVIFLKGQQKQHKI
jgi:hypothetical protein